MRRRSHLLLRNLPPRALRIPPHTLLILGLPLLRPNHRRRPDSILRLHRPPYACRTQSQLHRHDTMDIQHIRRRRHRHADSGDMGRRSRGRGATSGDTGNITVPMHHVPQDFKTASRHEPFRKQLHESVVEVDEAGAAERGTAN